MSIQSDKWIRRMAEQHHMIEPFGQEWEGCVTLEFSNTTPLPAKILRNVLQGARRQVSGAGRVTLPKI